MPVTLIDAGPLTALLNPNDDWHSRAREIIQRLPAPLLTSEPVLTEVSYLLRRDRCDADELFTLAEEDVIRDWKFFLDNDEWLKLWTHRYGESGARALAEELRRLPWRAKRDQPHNK